MNILTLEDLISPLIRRCLLTLVGAIFVTQFLIKILFSSRSILPDTLRNSILPAITICKSGHIEAYNEPLQNSKIFVIVYRYTICVLGQPCATEHCYLVQDSNQWWLAAHTSKSFTMRYMAAAHYCLDFGF